LLFFTQSRNALGYSLPQIRLNRYKDAMFVNTLGFGSACVVYNIKAFGENLVYKRYESLQGFEIELATLKLLAQLLPQTRSFFPELLAFDASVQELVESPPSVRFKSEFDQSLPVELMDPEKAPALADFSVELLRQLLLAVKSLHSLGVVHRDIKPDNVFRQSGGTILLNDFSSVAKVGERVCFGYLCAPRYSTL
jgi:serine/threonine protein kinase